MFAYYKFYYAKRKPKKKTQQNYCLFSRFLIKEERDGKEIWVPAYKQSWAFRQYFDTEKAMLNCYRAKRPFWEDHLHCQVRPSFRCKVCRENFILYDMGPEIEAPIPKACSPECFEILKVVPFL